MTRNEIKKNVLSKIDEISPFQETDEQCDLLMESMLDDCANRYLCLIPIHLIRPIGLKLYDNQNTANWNFERGVGKYHDLGIVYLPIHKLPPPPYIPPQNWQPPFLRLAYVNCLEWRRVVTEAKPVTAPEYNRQFNFHTRAGVAKPMAFLDTDNVLYTGKRLIISPFRDAWGINELEISYIPQTLPEFMQEQVLDGFYWFFASYVLESMQRPDFAKVAMAKFGEFLVNKQ